MGFNKTNERVNVLGSSRFKVMMVNKKFELNFGYHKTTSGTSEQKYRSKWWWCIVGSKGRDSKGLELD